MGDWGLKSIELQVAVPRTVDVSKTLQELQHRGELMSQLSHESMEKENEIKRKSVHEMNQKELQGLHERDHHNRKNKAQLGIEKRKKSKKKIQSSHPYKGKTIDYSG